MIPDLGDPSWLSKVSILLQFLDKPRNWRALRTWAKGHGIGTDTVRHTLAWLSIRNRAEWRDKVWRAIGSARVS